MKPNLTRRQVLTASAALASSACKRNKGTGFFGYALIANQGDNSLSAVDLTAFRLAKTIALGAAPSAVLAAESSAAHLAYVLTPSNGTVHLIDATLTRTTVQRLAPQISGLRLATDRRSLVAIAPESRELIQADAATLRPLGRHRLSFEPAALDVSDTHAAVAGGPNGTVALINLSTGQRTQIDASHPIGAMRFRADGKLLLLANPQARSIVALDVPTLQTVVELPLAMQPENLCFNADQGQLFVSGPGMDGVAVVFPYNTLEVDQTLLAGRAPGVMACSETPAYLFVASQDSSSVCVINIDTRKQLGLVEVGGKPTFLATTPDSQYALILNEMSGDMAVIHIPAIRTNSSANRLKNGTALFTVLNVGSKPVHAAIVRRG